MRFQGRLRDRVLGRWRWWGRRGVEEVMIINIDGGTRWWWLRTGVGDWPESSPEMGAAPEMIIGVGGDV
nr:hypothetical protein [Tanacetum cinerariifolium]